MTEETVDINSNVESLVTMLRMAHSFENWDNLIILSDELLEKIYSPYRDNAKMEKPIMDRSLVYYLGYCNLMKGLAFQKKKQYKEAKICIENYKDLSLFSDGSDSDNLIVEDFSFFAKANMHTVNILSGDTTNLEGYALFIRQYPSETLPGLVTILESANTHNLDVDKIIKPLLDETYKLTQEDMTPTDSTYFLSILYLLSIYNFKKNNFGSAIDFTIQALTFSDKMNEDKQFKKYVALFELLRPNALPHQIEAYTIVLKNYLLGVIENEEGFSLDSNICRNS